MLRRRHAHDQAGRGDQSVIGAQHRRAQPADAVDPVKFAMHAVSLVPPSAAIRCSRPRAARCGSSCVQCITPPWSFHSYSPYRLTMSPSAQSVQARRQIQIVRNQQGQPAGSADHEALVRRSVAIVGQTCASTTPVALQSSGRGPCSAYALCRRVAGIRLRRPRRGCRTGGRRCGWLAVIPARKANTTTTARAANFRRLMHHDSAIQNA